MAKKKSRPKAEEPAAQQPDWYTPAAEEWATAVASDLQWFASLDEDQQERQLQRLKEAAAIAERGLAADQQWLERCINRHALRPCPPGLELYADVLSKIAAVQILLENDDQMPAKHVAAVVDEVFRDFSLMDDPETPAAPIEDELSTKAAWHHLERLRLLCVKRIGSNTQAPPVSPPASSPAAPLPEGDWLMPPLSLADLAVRLKNIPPEKAKRLLTPYELQNYPKNNRQSWTVRLDRMPTHLREQVEHGRRLT